MIATNTMSAAAVAAGHSLGVARAVGRNVRALRATNALSGAVAPIGDAAIEPADLRKLAAAGLVELAERPISRTRQAIISYSLTAAGRALAARL
jgi:hypothetical protein